MKLSIKTTKLQDMVARAVKGASCNKLLPITSLMAIELKSNKLTLITTDGTNYLYIIEDSVEGDDFYVVVQSDTFSKLVAKTTSDTIVLEVKDTGELSVTGNGNYLIELPLDEDGKAIVYPDPVSSLDKKKGKTSNISRGVVQSILNTVKYSLATDVNVPCYTGYYCGDKVVATDSYKCCSLNVPIFDDPYLISQELMNLLGVVEADTIEVKTYDYVLVFTTPDCVIYGVGMSDIDEFSIDAVSNLLETAFSSMCKLSKSGLIQVLDRIGLFVGTYDKNAVYLTFTEQGLQISSKATSGVEVIKYVDSENFTPFTCCVDIEMLTTQIKAQAGDVVELWYGEDNALRTVDGDVVQITGLMTDDRAS